MGWNFTCQIQLTTSSTIDITVIMVTINTNSTIGVNFDRGISSHLAHRTSAIDIIGHGTAFDFDLGITTNYTSDGVKFITFTIVWVFNISQISIIQIRTATAAIDVTAISIIFFHITDSTAIHGHQCIVEDMSILTATIERTINLRTGSLIIFSTYLNFRIINPCQLIMDSIWSINITS